MRAKGSSLWGWRAAVFARWSLLAVVWLGAACTPRYPGRDLHDYTGLLGQRLASLEQVLSDPQSFSRYYPDATRTTVTTLRIDYYGAGGQRRGHATLNWDQAYVFDADGTLIGEARAFADRVELYDQQRNFVASRTVSAAATRSFPAVGSMALATAQPTSLGFQSVAVPVVALQAAAQPASRDGGAASAATYTPRNAGAQPPTSMFQGATGLTVDLILALHRAGTSEEALITIIRDSSTRFELDVDELLELRQQGISDRVIREMLRSGREPAPSPPVAGPPAAGQDIPLASATPSLGAPTLAASLPVEVNSVEEGPPGSQEHEHVALVHGGLELLYIRDEGHDASTRARAEEAAGVLEVALRTPGAAIELRWEGGEPELWVRTGIDDRPLLHVSRSDAIGYARRSRGTVEPALLAAWWFAVLSDYVAMVRDGDEPRLVMTTHEGHALAELFEALQAETGPGAPITGATLRAALLSLDEEDRDHLRDLARSVPDDFSLRLPPRRGSRR